MNKKLTKTPDQILDETIGSKLTDEFCARLEAGGREDLITELETFIKAERKDLLDFIIYDDLDLGLRNGKREQLNKLAALVRKWKK